MMNHRRVFSVVLIVLSTILINDTLLADSQKSKGKPEKANNEASVSKHGMSVDAKLSVMVTAGISIDEARKLASRYKLTGNKPLPHGIRKNLNRGKPMPPGIKQTRLPDSFVIQLPHHEGFEWQQAGTDLVLVVTGSLVISDVLQGVFD